jgi:hypothetical protein
MRDYVLTCFPLAGVHIVSGTPGRVFDMIRRQNLRTRGIKVRPRGPPFCFPPGMQCW